MTHLDVADAAKFLHLSPLTVLRKAREGKIPATKAAGKWLFPLDLLNEFLAVEWPPCPSHAAQTRRTGGSTYNRPLAQELEKALALPIKRKPKGFTTN